MCPVASGNRQETRSLRPGFVRFCYRALGGCVMHYVIIKTIVTSIAAATIALAAPAQANTRKTVCPSRTNGLTHAQKKKKKETCAPTKRTPPPRAKNPPPKPRGPNEAPGTYNGYVRPNGYGVK